MVWLDITCHCCICFKSDEFDPLHLWWVFCGEGGLFRHPCVDLYVKSSFPSMENKGFPRLGFLWLRGWWGVLGFNSLLRKGWTVFFEENVGFGGARSAWRVVLTFSDVYFAELDTMVEMVIRCLFWLSQHYMILVATCKWWRNDDMAL